MTPGTLTAAVCLSALAVLAVDRQDLPAAAWPVRFTDVAESAGLVHPSVYGDAERKRFIIETNGAGAAFVDYDRDGWIDALVLSGTRLEERARRDVAWGAGKAPLSRLYRNRRNGTFEDVTARVGLDKVGWASGVCAGDYDNDGWIDLFVTYFGQNVLYRNHAGQRFEDVTAAAGVAAPGTRWGSGCSFIDFDRDGDVDLFVANYLKYDLATAPEPGEGPNCQWKGVPVNCGPKGLPTDTNVFYRNRGNGTFEDVSTQSGVAQVTGRYPMTALAADLDEDGWTDLYVASDSTAAILYRNNRDGTFTDVAVRSGAAFNEQGSPQAGMGAALADVNNDGRLDLLKTHFADDIPALYRNLGRGLFEDVATVSGLSVQNQYVEWGAGMPDFDNDGDVDVLVMNMNERPSLLRNDYAGSNAWLTIRLEGRASNRLALGALVTVVTAAARQTRAVLSQSSYYSHDDVRLHFGLGTATRAERVEVRWPLGATQVLTEVPARQVLLVREPPAAAR